MSSKEINKPTGVPSSGLTIYTGNRLERLVKDLARVVRPPLSSPFSREFIVVQSQGMERWVSMALARLNGITANTTFPFPNAFLHHLFNQMTPDLPDMTLFDPDAMAFAIMDVLPEKIIHPGFEILNAYLADDPTRTKLYQISEKIADLFDQYLVFRPQMMLAWESGKANHWQATLWRSITQKTDVQHRARMQRRFINKIRNGSLAIDPLFERISVFGISYLPPFHIQVFEELAHRIPVTLFLMNPCRFYWDDIVSEYEKKRIVRKYEKAGIPKSDLHLEGGNRLLASWGTLGRDFFKMVHDLDCEVVDRFEPSETTHILSQVQKDILNLKDRSQRVDSDNLSVLSDSFDESIQIHSCHSPMREMEVLYDRLLSMFEADPALQPNDIIVMTPDIESYAPFIHSIFDTPPADLPRIPYTLADRNVGEEKRVIDGFRAMLQLPQSRLEVSRIFDLLEFQEIRNRFNLTTLDMENIERWGRENHICWGMDKNHRMEFNIPGFVENTWQAGLDRLILGYALPGQEQNLFKTILPYDPIEGESAGSLNRFLIFWETVRTYYNELNKDRTLDRWNEYLNQLIEDVFGEDETIETELQLIRRILSRMARAGNLAEYQQPVNLKVIRACLDRHFDHAMPGSRFISGGVTFCRLLPMRSIPAKVICLVGMNHAAFPRSERHLGFDLMAKYPKPGDRSSRNDDKFLFLESLISAREKLYISYVGQHIQDNTPIPPAVPVSQLLQYLTEGFGGPEDHWLNSHRLQPFSPGYFEGDPRFFSYSENDFKAAVQTETPPLQRPFIKGPLPIPSQPWASLDMETLCLFFTHPAKFFLTQRLGVFITEQSAKLSDREPFHLDPLNRYLMAQKEVEDHFSDKHGSRSLQFHRAKGELPHGQAGEVTLKKMKAETKLFIQKIEPTMSTKPLAPFEVELVVGDFTLFGKIDGIYDGRMIRFRYANHTAKDLIRTWLWHLLLCATEPPVGLKETRLLCRDKCWHFEPVQNSKSILHGLLSVYLKGLCEPIHFFPDPSYVYAKACIIRGLDPAGAQDRAFKTWEGNDFKPGVSRDRYNRRCFDTINPIDAAFETLTLDLFDPLLNHMSEIDLRADEPI